jgi:dTDP-4-dehydrorhamnose reductase
MKVLIIGGSGMLGHKLWQVLSERFNTFVTFRQPASSYTHYGLFDPSRMIGNISIGDFDSLTRMVAQTEPDVIVNCIGIVKQDAEAKDPLTSISVNAHFPHRLAQLCQVAKARLIHISTDCVFSGRKGNYRESDVSDAEDLYGRTKFLGEVGGPGCLTIRTSMIGRELRGAHGLIEWFLSREGETVLGFRRAIFSGFTTHALSEIIASIISDHPQLEGVWHVASEPINKFDLLTLVKETAKLDINIEPDETFVCDRSLVAERFREATGFVPLSWSDMIWQLFQDKTLYSKIRRLHC